ncbi:hypothetical protein F2P79_022284 [Pimephales promelas]|nr:hypothetical protein F2P79_022284 [Pimephales promelas]
MGKSEKRKNKSNVSQKNANLATANSESQHVFSVPGAVNMHDYVKTDLVAVSDDFLMCKEEFPASLDSPCKSPAAKQRKSERSDIADVLSQLGALSQLINSRSDSLEKLIGENTRAITNMKEVINENTKQITSVKEAIEFMSEEVNSLKLKYGVVEAKVGKVDQATNEQERRLAHLESYSRRWNLRFHGVPEKEREDVRQRIIQLCQQLLPEDKDKLPNAIDTVHRLGRKEPNKSRGIICQFASRFFRDAVWRAAKESAFLRENGLKISEDLSPADKERRNKLWPVVEKARQNNKRAYFVGGRAFVEGVETFPPT